MRRIIQNTTAIAACLSLLAPHAVLAQADASAEAAAAAAAEAEGSGETCADGTQPPCAPAIEAAPVEETAPVEEAAPTEEPAAEAPAAEGGADAVPEAVVEELAPVEAEAEAEAMEPAPEAEAEALEAAPEAETAPEAEAAAPEPATEPAEQTAAPTAEDAATEASEAVEAPATVEAETGAETSAEGEASDPLAEALAKEAEAAAEAEAEVTAEPEASSTPETAAPVTTATEATAEEKTPDASAAETTTPVEVVESAAAKAAAEATAAPTAAALSDEAGDGEVTEEEVTEANTRSSAEDFQAALEGALKGEGQQAEAAATDDGDDDNDLTKALLLGLGGLAVGSMLNNNREVSLSTPDRVVVTHPDGSQQIIKDEVALLRQPGSTVTTENFDDGSSRTTVTRADGSKVVTIRDADLRVLRRSLVSADGTTTMLIDDTAAEPVDVARLPAPAAAAEAEVSQMSEDDLRAALRAESAVDRRFSLSQIRNIAQVRSLVAPVNIDAITFDTGSAAIQPDQAQKLSALGNVIRERIAENPAEVFLVEAHTDTVGSDAANLALSDRRAESVALALSEYFQVPPENLVVQGYGEQQLKVAREGDVRENRRAAVRRITGLLQQAQ